MNKGKTKKSKYDVVYKLPVSFEEAMGMLATATPKKKIKK
jgi:hypothetical protein